MDYLAAIATHFGVHTQESFRHFLSENDLNRLDQGVQEKVPARLELFDPRRLLGILHPSWIRDQVVSGSVNQRALFEKIQDKICVPGALPENLRLFVLNQIFASPADQELPDRKNAESCRLSVLLGKSQAVLELVFQCIGCHFLSVNLRQVIAKKDLDHVIKSLDPRTRRYLRKLMFASKKLEVTPLGVKVTNCSQEELQATLGQQGLAVFQQILQTVDSDFTWYFLRQFDVEFAHKLITTEKSHSHVSIEKWIDAVCEIERYLEEKDTL